MANCISEHTECVLFANILKKTSFVLYYSKIPMEIWTSSYNQIRKHKQEGMNKGVFDYEIYIKTVRGDIKLVKIEMKRKKGGTVSKEQKEVKKLLDKANIPAYIAKGYQDAFNFLKKIYAEEDISTIG